MKRLLLLTGAAVGACAIAVPAAAGLSANPSFSERVPVRVPSSAKIVTFDDHGGATTITRPPAPTSTTSAGPRPGEPGDDRGTHRPVASRTGTHAEPGDDHGIHTEPGDDHHRNRGAATSTAITTPRHGGSDDVTTGHGGGHGKDD